LGLKRLCQNWNGHSLEQDEIMDPIPHETFSDAFYIKLASSTGFELTFANGFADGPVY
jgi:hypothetical protein